MWDKKERKGLEKDSKPCAFWLVVLFIKTTLTRKEESGKEVASSGFNIRFSCCVMGEFQINVVDCQPVHEEATPSQTTVLLMICGSVKFEGNKQWDFNQNFILTAQASPTNTVWMIASDCFRFQDWVS
ncbi:NTF2-related export protein 1 [Cricetulus griseus]|uniref:Nuclear transport factor 2 n=1 Tax=Cricetulus griseus TaxID=10029 RepID=G3IAE5_CRIGR|nr:NTF2-related export protein 1 [Cricetulus griseus]